jgi:hypothetical protein
MYSQELCSPKIVTAIKGSLWLAAAVLFWDVACEGCYIFSLGVCPLWLLISLVTNAFRRPGWRIGVVRILMPLMTFGIAFVNGNLQWMLADVSAERVVKACDEFHIANGRYPKTLDELVPSYLSSVPRAKYCFGGRFWYFNYQPDGPCMLTWTRYGFYRRLYNFHTKRWGNLD